VEHNWNHGKKKDRGCEPPAQNDPATRVEVTSPAPKHWIVPNWIIPAVISAAMTLDGPGNVLVKTIVLFICAVWLCADLWFRVATAKLRGWRNILYCVACTLILSATSAICWWLASQRFNEDQRLASTGLIATAITPPDLSPFETTFAITNGSEHALGKHSFRCGIKLIAYNNGGNWFSEFSTRTVQYDGPINAGGDRQTYQCLNIFVMPRDRVDCLDITMHLDYVLLSQPNTPEMKEFHYTANRRDGFLWTGQPHNDSTDYCLPYLTEKAQKDLEEATKRVVLRN
jgi:hypothetical protein